MDLSLTALGKADKSMTSMLGCAHKELVILPIRARAYVGTVPGKQEQVMGVAE